MFLVATLFVLGVSTQRALVVEGSYGVVATEPVEYLYPGMLPDNPLYFLKDLRYKVQGLFVFGDENKTAWYLKLADKKLAEARALTEKNETNLAAKSAAEGSEMSQKAQDSIKQMNTAGKDTTVLITKLRQNSERQQAVLTKVLEKVPLSAKGAISNALSVSSRGLQQAIIAQEKQRPATGSGNLSTPPGKNKGVKGK